MARDTPPKFRIRVLSAFFVAALVLLPISLIALSVKLILYYKPEEADSVLLSLLSNTGFWIVCAVIGSTTALLAVVHHWGSGELSKSLIDQNPALKAKYDFIEPGSSKLPDLKDVVLLPDARQQAMEVVDLLVNPKRYATTKARPVKGTLLIGPTGNGKTMLAKAIAKRSGATFISISGSAIAQIFKGLGSVRLQEMFAVATEHSPAIIFIDELDALGKLRGPAASLSGSADDSDQTLNQLLVEMDGMLEQQNVVVLGATNRPDTLDPALVRPGRFERHIHVGNPDGVGRLALLETTIKSRGVPTDLPEGYLKRLAAESHGFSGAAMTRLVNEAAICAAINRSPNVEPEHLEEGKFRTLIGTPGNLPLFGSTELLEQYVRSIAVKSTVAYCLGAVGPLRDDTALQNAVTSALPEAERVDDIRSEFHFQIATTRIVKRQTGTVIITPPVRESSYRPSMRRVLFELAILLAPYVAQEEIYKCRLRYAGDNGDFNDAEELAQHAVSSWALSGKPRWTSLLETNTSKAESNSESDDLAKPWDSGEHRELLKQGIELARAILRLESVQAWLGEVVKQLQETHLVSYHVLNEIRMREQA